MRKSEIKYWQFLLRKLWIMKHIQVALIKWILMNINNRKPYIDSQNTMASNYSSLIQIKMKNKYYQRISESPLHNKVSISVLGFYF